ncbi:MAG: type II toxin-antitoxin system Phd/YefM family antitoxin, partial [Pseudomonadota bacterium]
VSSREFNQDVSSAKRFARLEPVFVTDRGRPTHVLLSIDAFRQLTGHTETMVDLLAMPDERFLILQMHELLSYLNQLGVLSILVLAQHGLMGPMQTPIDLSYLSDSVLMLRYFEFEGSVRRALSVVKKRSGTHELTIREFKLGARGLMIGEPLREFSGVFTGTPHYTGSGTPLLDEDA